MPNVTNLSLILVLLMDLMCQNLVVTDILFIQFYTDSFLSACTKTGLPTCPCIPYKPLQQFLIHNTIMFTVLHIF